MVLDMLYETPEVSIDTCPNSRGTLSFPPLVKKSPVFPASTRDEALFLCIDPSGVPRGPSNLTIFLTFHKHSENLLRSLSHFQGSQSFLLQLQKDFDIPPSTHLEARFPCSDSRAMPCSPSQLECRLNFLGVIREAP